MNMHNSAFAEYVLQAKWLDHCLALLVLAQCDVAVYGCVCCAFHVHGLPGGDDLTICVYHGGQAKFEC